MALRYYANAPATTLTGSVTSVATTLPVASTAGLPISYPYTLILDRGTATEEAVSVTAAAGLDLTVTRGIDSTTAFAHASGATVAHGITAQDPREANAHVNATSGVHGATGNLVGTTDVQALILATHPVGSIFMHTVNTNPSAFLGGTWVAWGSGRVPVGVDTSQTEFDTVEETGGAKTHTLTTAEMPSHTHTQNPHSHVHNPHQHGMTLGWNEIGATNWDANFGSGLAFNRGFNTLTDAATSTEQSATATNQNTGGGGAHNNLQPYITCYMFKRTA